MSEVCLCEGQSSYLLSATQRAHSGHSPNDLEKPFSPLVAALTDSSASVPSFTLGQACLVSVESAGDVLSAHEVRRFLSARAAQPSPGTGAGARVSAVQRGTSAEGWACALAGAETSARKGEGVFEILYFRVWALQLLTVRGCPAEGSELIAL